MSDKIDLYCTVNGCKNEQETRCLQLCKEHYKRLPRFL